MNMHGYYSVNSNKPSAVDMKSYKMSMEALSSKYNRSEIEIDTSEISRYTVIS